MLPKLPGACANIKEQLANDWLLGKIGFLTEGDQQMDPSTFLLDWDRVFEALAAIVVLSMFVERSLALVFEHRWYDKMHGKGMKSITAFVVSFFVCKYWEFDAVSIIFSREHTVMWGYFLTAGVISGGSKGSMKLFQDVMGWKKKK